jgi:hypothetical protein
MNLDDEDLGEAEQFCRRMPAVPRQDDVIFIDHDWYDEAELLHALGNLPNLLGRMRTGVGELGLRQSMAIL